MAATPPAPQRVCPHCSTLAATAEDHCPWCGRSYRRRILPGVAVLLALAVAATLAGIAALGLLAADRLEARVDEEVSAIERDLDRDVRRIERTIEERLPTVPPTPVAP